MSHREHLAHLDTGQRRAPQQKVDSAALPAQATGPASAPPVKSEPTPVPQETAAAPLPPARHGNSGIRSRLVSEPDDRIAKTHAELLALERQGTRTYTEFSLTKSKRFQMIGPVAVQLRKVDTKHGYYDLKLTVNGRQLEKKHVNLYEPIWITTNEYERPSQLVVNTMSKNQVWGYWSAPKLTNSELAQKRANRRNR